MFKVLMVVSIILLGLLMEELLETMTSICLTVLFGKKAIGYYIQLAGFHLIIKT